MATAIVSSAVVGLASGGFFDALMTPIALEDLFELAIPTSIDFLTMSLMKKWMLISTDQALRKVCLRRLVLPSPAGWGCSTK